MSDKPKETVILDLTERHAAFLSALHDIGGIEVLISGTHNEMIAAITAAPNLATARKRLELAQQKDVA